MLDCEAQVGESRRWQGKRGFGCPDRLHELSKPVYGDRREDTRLVAEMGGWRGVGDPGLAGQLPEAQSRRAPAGYVVEGGLKQYRTEVAVMVGPRLFRLRLPGIRSRRHQAMLTPTTSLEEDG